MPILAAGWITAIVLLWYVTEIVEPTFAPGPSRASSSQTGSRSVGFDEPGLTVITGFRTSNGRAADTNAENEGFFVAFTFSRPLCQRLTVWSRKMNQMNIWTWGSLRTIASDCLRYAACCDAVTPFGWPGLVWKPYSVTQNGTDFRLNHFERSLSKAGICGRFTFG